MAGFDDGVEHQQLQPVAHHLRSLQMLVHQLHQAGNPRERRLHPGVVRLAFFFELLDARQVGPKRALLGKHHRSQLQNLRRGDVPNRLQTSPDLRRPSPHRLPHAAQLIALHRQPRPCLAGTRPLFSGKLGRDRLQRRLHVLDLLARDVMRLNRRDHARDLAGDVLHASLESRGRPA